MNWCFMVLLFRCKDIIQASYLLSSVSLHSPLQIINQWNTDRYQKQTGFI